MESRTISIIGGGFAGPTLARALNGELPPGYELLPIRQESHNVYANAGRRGRRKRFSETAENSNRTQVRLADPLQFDRPTQWAIAH